MALVVALMFLGPLFLYRFFDVTRSNLTDQHRVREAWLASVQVVFLSFFLVG